MTRPDDSEPFDEQEFEHYEYPQEMDDMLDALMLAATAQYVNAIPEKGHYPVGEGEPPGWHYWKANGEEHKARAAAEDDDFLEMLEYTAHAVNHLVMALTEVYVDQVLEPQELAERVVKERRREELRTLIRDMAEEEFREIVNRNIAESLDRYR